MIGITKLLCGTVTPSDALRYGRDSRRMPAHLLQFSQDERPVVVWNMTRRCNLRCVHCYAKACADPDDRELTTDEAKAMIDDLADMQAPVLLFSGGEPLTRDDIFELGTYAYGRGIRPVISSNGTLITPETAERIHKANFQYVGISLDGMGETNDRFRAMNGAFDMGVQGIRNCAEAGVKVGLRFTITKLNQHDLDAILDLLVEEGIGRFCMYHLVYAGRGAKLAAEDLSHAETRAAMDLLFARTQEFVRQGRVIEVLTVDNHADGVYLYRRVRQEQPEREDEVLRLLRMNGGNGSGSRIGCVDHEGNVHADQFWRHHSFGNVRERSFSEIWRDTSDPLMRGLKVRKAMVKGRCGRCRYLDICGGNFRVRAEAVHGDVWAEDPACYLTEDEIQS